MGVAIAAAVVLVVVLLIVQGLAWTDRPCCGGGEECGAGTRYCPGPEAPAPTTFLAPGTVFTIPAGQYLAFELQPSYASQMVLNGSFESTEGVRVILVLSYAYANFSAAPSTFPCTPSVLCYSTGPLGSGTFYETVGDYAGSSPGAVPWFLVQQDPNATAPTSVTWTTGLVAQYEWITA